MFLSTGPSFEFIRLIQILCWILLPIGAAVILLTVFFHYRNKRKDRVNEVSEEEFLKASPELLGYTNGDGEYVLFDQSSVLAEYKKKLLYYHARYTALRHDFDKLELKYDALGSYATAKFMDPTISEDVGIAYRQIPRALQKQIDDISAQHEAERQELLKDSQQALVSSVEYIESLKADLAELKRQNALLLITAEEYKQLAHSLQNQLSQTEVVKEQLVDTLETNKQLLQQLNNDINASADSDFEDGQSPVIPLRPEYASIQGSTAQAGINYH
jgi:hypothetical protein